MNGFQKRESLFTVLLLIGVFAELTSSFNVAQIRAELARGGRHVCPYCWACVHSWNCNRPCRPNYRDLCPLCAYRFHCSSTCVNVCPFPETTTAPQTTTTPAPTTPPTTTPEPTTPPPTTPDDVCRPNPCPFNGTCQIHATAPGGYVCSCPANSASCTGDERCEDLSGRCQTDSISCLGGYRSSLCSGASDRKCCLPDPGDTECSDLNGFCQDSSASCPGEYRSGLCVGSSNRRCCLPEEDKRCNSQSGTCQLATISCSGSYHSGLCGGAYNRKCCLRLPTTTSGGSGRVDYRGYSISDGDVKDKLQEIANLFGNRLWVTSGDRNNNGRSHHDVGRAADFWIDGGLSGGTMFDRIRDSGILDRDYQVIWHGADTVTGGQHIHIGHYGDGRVTCWVHEGTTSSNRGVYRCM